MITFKTLYSTYEVDETNKRIRRITGINPPTNNQGADGEYKEYIAISPIQPNHPAFIEWLDGKLTRTSLIESIEV